MKLSKRLQAICDLINENSNIIELRKGPISLNDVLEACKQ